ncbi:hypothetical protein SARC_03370 [Sphaeroforma arctica JP610]|uniref:Tyrosine-protein phosphatase domain-containing protein n=1 Tax=Sphaeroforma arctica JP610 TaxID=667725 RepID=A0A0L0G832_9EUKA|nr:hypothetical protein SARC_03370 [Sphaeroforma arctica JP610]KNC84408.1 hypothetical protein SARC_03370 [Sphaeroforma arctica JP610]|eukprot:XP_014158310.1 hypothetical protein SARC_03370 [Sphaeroforma arctica JP610]
MDSAQRRPDKWLQRFTSGYERIYASTVNFHFLPACKEGALVDLKLKIDKEETEKRKADFDALQRRIREEALTDYFANTSTALAISTEITEIWPQKIYFSTSKLQYHQIPLEKLNVSKILMVLDVDGLGDVPEDVQLLHIRLEEGSRSISRYFNEVVAFVKEVLDSPGKSILMCGLTDAIACLAAAVIITERKIRLAPTIAHIRKRLPGVAPNFAYISELTNYENEIFDVKDSAFLAKYVMETLPGWDATLEDVQKALEANKNDVAKAMDVLCPSTKQ